MVDPDRRREQQQQHDEREARERVREDLPFIGRQGAVGGEERELGDEEEREDDRHQDAVDRQCSVVIHPWRHDEPVRTRENLEQAETEHRRQAPR
jgi:hypothetical protein